jgi:hypothetical protein
MPTRCPRSRPATPALSNTDQYAEEFHRQLKGVIIDEPSCSTSVSMHGKTSTTIIDRTAASAARPLRTTTPEDHHDTGPRSKRSTSVAQPHLRPQSKASGSRQACSAGHTKHCDPVPSAETATSPVKDVNDRRPADPGRSRRARPVPVGCLGSAMAYDPRFADSSCSGHAGPSLDPAARSVLCAPDRAPWGRRGTES